MNTQQTNILSEEFEIPEYNADLQFATFWFNLSRKVAQSYFPENFRALQNAAANSKEARTKIVIA